MNRRGFLKGLSALAVPLAITQVAKNKELTDLEKAQKVDIDFNSPFLYVEAREDIKQGQVVDFADISKENPYRVAVHKNSLGYVKPCGIATTNVNKGQWFFIQTVGHCELING